MSRKRRYREARMWGLDAINAVRYAVCRHLIMRISGGIDGISVEVF